MAQDFGQIRVAAVLPDRGDPRLLARGDHHRAGPERDAEQPDPLGRDPVPLAQPVPRPQDILRLSHPTLEPARVYCRRTLVPQVDQQHGEPVGVQHPGREEHGCGAFALVQSVGQDDRGSVGRETWHPPGVDGDRPIATRKPHSLEVGHQVGSRVHGGPKLGRRLTAVAAATVGLDLCQPVVDPDGEDRARAGEEGEHGHHDAENEEPAVTAAHH